jgi:early secretory antigenic target protein ESAT-6
MATYEVSIPNMNAAVGDVQQVATAISNLLNELNADCQTTLSTWTGDAQAQYHAAQAKWNAAAANMPTAIQTGAQTLSSIADGYARAEQAGMNTFGG